jgi:hypothetical protein
MTEQQAGPRSTRDRDEGLRGTETKAAFKTTELIFYVLAVVGVLIASLLVDGGEGNPDPFGAEQAWRYVTYLTIGYMISRGLAKAGSRNPRD